MARLPQNGRTNPRIDQKQETVTYGGRKSLPMNGKTDPRIDQAQPVVTYGGRAAVQPGARIAQEQRVVTSSRNTGKV